MGARYWEETAVFLAGRMTFFFAIGIGRFVIVHYHFVARLFLILFMKLPALRLMYALPLLCRRDGRAISSVSSLTSRASPALFRRPACGVGARALLFTVTCWWWTRRCPPMRPHLAMSGLLTFLLRHCCGIQRQLPRGVLVLLLGARALLAA